MAEKRGEQPNESEKGVGADLPAKLIVKMAEGGGLIEGKFFWGGGVIIWAALVGSR